MRALAGHTDVVDLINLYLQDSELISYEFWPAIHWQANPVERKRTGSGSGSDGEGSKEFRTTPG